MKVCADCKHYGGEWPHRCSSPRIKRYVDPITGVAEQKWKFADFQRQLGWLSSRLDGACGREARFYEPKNALLADGRTT